jgi:hypothetical protein
VVSKCSGQRTESNDVSYLGVRVREPPYHEKASATEFISIDKYNFPINKDKEINSWEKVI